MPFPNTKSDSLVEKHVHAVQKVWGSILGQVETFLISETNLHEFYTDITGKNTSSKHERYTRNGANRISSLTRV